jgi:hypothetical protein
MDSEIATTDETQAAGAEVPVRGSHARLWLVTGCCWLTAILLGAVQAWAGRHRMGADGMSYMDLADAWRTGHWQEAVNAYWSPGYSWLLAIGLAIVQPPEYWEAGVAHLVNFAGYLFALGCFHYFWSGLCGHVHKWACSRQDDGLPQWAWIVLGYGLFTWSMLNWITLDATTPDVYVAAFLFLDAGILVRIRRGSAGWGTFVLLGLALGAGYLIKAILWPMAWVFVITGLLAAGRWRWAVPRFLVSCAIFALVASPWVWAMSKSKGRFTPGDAGKMNYAAQVNGFYPWDVWQGDAPPPGCGKPKHPTRRILEKPAVFEFATPVPGTYPLWYDPSYWHDGAEPHFNLPQQWAALGRQVKVLFPLFFREQGLLLFVVLLLILARQDWTATARDLLRYWWLAAPALAGVGAYALVHVESRYLAPFIVLFWAAILAAVRLPRSTTSMLLLKSATITLLVGMSLMIGEQALPSWRQAGKELHYRRELTTNTQWRVAQEMRKVGLKPGDEIGHVGQALRSWSYWARLAKVRIVAELRPGDSFWLADDATRTKALAAFAGTGVKAVITRKMAPNERTFGLPYDFAPGWQPVGDTGYYIRFLDSPSKAPASRPATQPAVEAADKDPRLDGHRDPLSS